MSENLVVNKQFGHCICECVNVCVRVPKISLRLSVLIFFPLPPPSPIFSSLFCSVLGLKKLAKVATTH